MSKNVDFPYEDPDINYDEKPKWENEYKIRYSEKEIEMLNSFRFYVEDMIKKEDSISMLNSLIELAKIGSKTRIAEEGHTVIYPRKVDDIIDHYGDILKKELERYQKIVEVMKDERRTKY